MSRSDSYWSTERDVLLAFVSAANKYVHLGDDWSAWNNQDGHAWPELRAALAAFERLELPRESPG